MKHIQEKSETIRNAGKNHITHNPTNSHNHSNHLLHSLFPFEFYICGPGIHTVIPYFFPHNIIPWSISSLLHSIITIFLNDLTRLFDLSVPLNNIDWPPLTPSLALFFVMVLRLSMPLLCESLTPGMLYLKMAAFPSPLENPLKWTPPNLPGPQAKVGPFFHVLLSSWQSLPSLILPFLFLSVCMFVGMYVWPVYSVDCKLHRSRNCICPLSHSMSRTVNRAWRRESPQYTFRGE